MVPFPEPDVVMVHQAWSLEEIQVVLEVTVKEVLPAAVVTFWLAGVTDRVGTTPACVTVTTIGVSPVTVTVTFAIRWVVSIFCVYVAVIVPFPEPEAVTLHQV